MELSAELIGAATGAISAILTTAMGYGMIKVKVERLEKDQDRSVDVAVFDAHIKNITEQVALLRESIRELVAVIQRHDNWERSEK